MGVVQLSGGSVEIGSLTFKDKMHAVSKSIVYDQKGNPLHNDVVMLRYWKVVYSIRGGFLKGKTLEDTERLVANVNPTDGDLLYEEYRRENEVTPGELTASGNSSLSDASPKISEQ